MILIIAIAGFLILTVFLARRGGMGELGRRIRNSDYWALQDAILEREEAIEELEKELFNIKSLRPTDLWERQRLLEDIGDLKIELEQLINLKPKYKYEEKI